MNPCDNCERECFECPCEKEIDRLRTAIKQARANCYDDKPHKTMMKILDKALQGDKT